MIYHRYETTLPVLLKPQNEWSHDRFHLMSGSSCYLLRWILSLMNFLFFLRVIILNCIYSVIFTGFLSQSVQVIPKRISHNFVHILDEIDPGLPKGKWESRHCIWLLENILLQNKWTMNVNLGTPTQIPKHFQTQFLFKITFPSCIIFFRLFGVFCCVTFSELNRYFLFYNCVSYDWACHNSSNEIHSYALYAPPNVQTVGKLHQSLAEQSPLLWYPWA